MFTLPVSIHSLIWSKIIVSTVWFIVTIAAVAAAGIASVLRVRYITEFFHSLRHALPELTASQALDGTLVIVEVLLIVVLMAAAMCLMFYAALSTGHGFANHKMLLSVTAFVAFSVAAELVMSFISDYSLPETDFR